jgi:hypothetical protein
MWDLFFGIFKVMLIFMGIGVGLVVLYTLIFKKNEPPDITDSSELPGDKRDEIPISKSKGNATIEDRPNPYRSSPE